MRDYKQYLTYTRSKLIGRLGEVVADLSGAYEDYGFTKASELGEKASAWANCQETSVTARDKTATYSAMHISQSLLEIDARIKSLIEERDYLRLLVTHAVS